MNLTDFLYIGIAPTSGKKDFSYAVLDSNLNLIALTDVDMEDLYSFLAERTSAFIAVNAPARINQGLVKKRLEEENTVPGRSFRGVDIRLSEYELRVRGITVTGTPSHEEYCPAWMQAGFALFQELSKIGFKPYGTKDARCQYFETHPYACYCTLVEGIPFSKPSLEGRLQRQLILNNKGLQITDAMDFFEEITRFKLMKGVLPTDELFSPDQLDVLVAAYAAWLAANQPAEVTKVGDEREGQMILPVQMLKDKY